MKNKLIWRLGKLPSVEELLKLVNDKVISKEEMRDVLFNSETKEEVDKKSLEGEIKFLRELVTKLSTKSTIIETVRTIQPTYITQPWYGPYYTWCSTGTTGSYTTTTAQDGCSTISYATASVSGSAGGTNCFYVSSRGSAEGDDINPCSSACSVDLNTGDFDSIKTF
jgi:hypothetical protein